MWEIVIPAAGIALLFISLAIVGIVIWSGLDLDTEEEYFARITVRNVRINEGNNNYKDLSYSILVNLTLLTDFNVGSSLISHCFKMVTINGKNYEGVSCKPHLNERVAYRHTTFDLSFSGIELRDRPLKIFFETYTNSGQYVLSNNFSIPLDISCRRGEAFSPGDRPISSIKTPRIMDIKFSDINSDGRDELIISDFDEGIAILDHVPEENEKFIYLDLDIKNPNGFDIADVTGDGKVDLIATLWNSKSVRIYPGRGDGTFERDPSEILGEMRQPFQVKVRDMDIDGNLDLIVIYGHSQTGFGFTDEIMIFYGNSTHHHPGTKTLPEVDGRMDIGDLDLDGRPDIVAGGTIFFQERNGSFTRSRIIQDDGPAPFILKSPTEERLFIVYTDFKYRIDGRESYQRIDLKDKEISLAELFGLGKDNTVIIVNDNSLFILGSNGTNTLLTTNATNHPQAIGDLNGDGLLDYIKMNDIFIQSKDSDRDGIIDEYDPRPDMVD